MGIGPHSSFFMKHSVYNFTSILAVFVTLQSREMHQDESFTELLNSQQKLEFQMNRTQTWLSHLGRWKAHVLHTDVGHFLFFVYGCAIVLVDVSVCLSVCHSIGLLARNLRIVHISYYILRDS